MGLINRNLLTIDDLTPDELTGVLDLSRVLKLNKKRNNKKRLTDKNIIFISKNMLKWHSLPFVLACREEGACVETLDALDFPLNTDDFKNYAAGTLGRYFDLAGISGYTPEENERLARYSGKPVINYFSGAEQPIHTLADLFTIYEHFGTIEKLNLCILGGEAGGLAAGAAKAGMNVTAFKHTAGIRETAFSGEFGRYAGEIRVAASAEDALAGAHVVYADMTDINISEIINQYRDISDFTKYTKRDDTIILSGRSADDTNNFILNALTDKKSYISEQAENRIFAVKAVVVAALN